MNCGPTGTGKRGPCGGGRRGAEFLGPKVNLSTGFDGGSEGGVRELG